MNPLQNQADENPLELAAGTLLDDGNITVLNRLGSGGFGVTYRAMDTKYGEIALKEFLPRSMVYGRIGMDLSVQPDKRGLYDKCLSQFIRESRLLKDLRHPNIVRVFFEMQENGTAYYGMQLLKGRDLGSYLRSLSAPLAPGEAFDLLLPIMDALIYLHNHDTLHRDISPDNIFLRQTDSGFSPCLIDFGAASSAMNDYHSTFPQVKKKGYSPLEQNWDAEMQGPFTDVYALCATFYFMLTGQVPPPAADRGLGGADSLQPPSFYNPVVSREVDRILIHGLALRPADRIQNVIQLRTELTAVLTAAPIPSNVESDVSSTPEPPKPVTANTGRSLAPIYALGMDWLLLWAIPSLILAYMIPAGWAILAGMLLCLAVNGVLACLGGTLGQRIFRTQARLTPPRALLYSLLRVIPPVALADAALEWRRGEGFIEPMLRASGRNPESLESDVNSAPPERVPALVCVSGTLCGRRVNLDGTQWFGRDPQKTTVRYPASASIISKCHCAVRYQDGGWRVMDLNSHNGTTLNGRKLTPMQQSKPLKPGDRVKIGYDVYVYEE